MGNSECQMNTAVPEWKAGVVGLNVNPADGGQWEKNKVISRTKETGTKDGLDWEYVSCLHHCLHSLELGEAGASCNKF